MGRGGTFGGLFKFGCFCHAGWWCEWGMDYVVVVVFVVV